MNHCHSGGGGVPGGIAGSMKWIGSNSFCRPTGDHLGSAPVDSAALTNSDVAATLGRHDSTCSLESLGDDDGNSQVNYNDTCNVSAKELPESHTKGDVPDDHSSSATQAKNNNSNKIGLGGRLFWRKKKAKGQGIVPVEGYEKQNMRKDGKMDKELAAQLERELKVEDISESLGAVLLEEDDLGI